MDHVGTPQHELRKKIAKEQKEKKKQPDVVEQWYEMVPFAGKKGAKIVLCKKTVTGTSRSLAGHEKDGTGLFQKLKKEGKLRLK